MREGPPTVRLTPEAISELRADEALVFDWVRLAMCCGAAGEIVLRRTTVREVARAGTFVPLSRVEGLPVYAHRRACSLTVRQDISIHCRKRLGIRHFTHDLPPDFGLRAVFGRPTTHTQEEQPWQQHPAAPAS